MTDYRFICYLFVRLVVVIVFTGTLSPLTSDGLFWILLFLLFYTISSGWVYYLAFKFLDKDLVKGLLAIAVAMVIDLFFSKLMFDGAKELKPHLLYVGSGLFSFLLVWAFVKKPLKSEINNLKQKA